MNINDLVYGPSQTTNIVACEYTEPGVVEIFTESLKGVSSYTATIPYWTLGTRNCHNSIVLSGDLPLKYLTIHSDKRRWWDARKQGGEFLNNYDDRESAMLMSGFTHFKGMEPSDVSILSFDIETTGLVHDETSRVLIISNTFRRNGQIERKLFSADAGRTDAEMLTDWCEWVVARNPSIICGHNVYKFDFPYLDYCARANNVSLVLGRNNSPMITNTYESRFRYDQSEKYPFLGVNIYGRNVVDTFFLALRHDFVQKRYKSYGLKNIIRQEGLEAPGRVFYDGGMIGRNWHNMAEREKIIEYAMKDADDALALFDLMIPAYFYLARSVPKTFQNLMVTASGAQINSMLLRAYIVEGHSIPLPTEAEHFEGATTIGNPGIYKDVFKIDVASLYPSIMLEYRIEDSTKDPLGCTLALLSYLTTERLKNKQLAKETGLESYKSLSDAQKIIINSVYGFLGTNGIQFNAPVLAAEVTRKGREILAQAIRIAEADSIKLVNGDTDSISVCKGSMFASKELREAFLRGVNAQFPPLIKWEDDGYFTNVVVIKAKNYALRNGDKTTIKGSALKSVPKESALRELITTTIDLLLSDRAHCIEPLYVDYAREIVNLTSITRWSARKTISQAVLNPEHTTQKKIAAALAGTDYQQGDKRQMYFKNDDTLALEGTFTGDHNQGRLLSKLYKTICIFKPVLDISKFLNYSLKRNGHLLVAFKN